MKGLGEYIVFLLFFLPLLILFLRWWIKMMIEIYKESYKQTFKDKLKAAGIAMANGLAVIAFLALIAMCSYSDDPYSEREERKDEYQLRREPGW